MPRTKLLNLDGFNLRIFLILIVVAFLFFYPVLYGGAFYADDVYRINVTRKGFDWHRLGRVLATEVAKLLGNNSKMVVDASPLGWILSISLLGLSAKLLYCKFKEKYAPFALTLAIVFLINPFFIQNLLYRFDNLGMFLGMLFVVLAFSLNNTKTAFYVKALLLLVSLNFYQTFSNLFIALVAIEAALMGYRNFSGKDIGKTLLYSAGVFFAANIVYFVELKLFGTPSRGELLSFSVGSLALIANNYNKAFSLFLEFWGYYKIYLYTLIFVLLVAAIKAKQNAKFYFLLVVGVFLIYLSSIGLMGLIKNPEFSPRALHYFSPLMMLAAIVLIAGGQRFKWAMVIPVFACFIFSYQVGNVQKIQRDFEQPIAYGLFIDLMENKEIEKYYSVGQLPYSNYVENIRKGLPFNGYLYRYSWVTVGILQEYIPRDLLIFEWASQAKVSSKIFYAEKESMSILIERPYYKIYKGNEGEGWVVWQ